MSAFFLRADAHAICACIQAFHLNDLLYSVVRLDGLFACWQDPSSDRRTTMDPGMRPGLALCHISLALMGWHILEGKSQLSAAGFYRAAEAAAYTCIGTCSTAVWMEPLSA